eukprot:TRINITY_DN53653_c0_g1_i1.p1 TRINITY_DN53653_c0_g1~~TRINITY_DN53653_c0_g1_i1.p1  ORF type:complete len:152 (+),score=33.05 TRINITY_DN53653_c0_g1_i1:34-456(+)
MTSLLAGRWLVTRDEGADEGCVIVNSEGVVSFVGEEFAEGEELKLVEAEATDGGLRFTLIQMPSKKLGDVLYKDLDGDQQELILSGPDFEEKWRRTSSSDGSPKIVTRKAASIMRRWTRESPDNPAEPGPKKASAGTGEA